MQAYQYDLSKLPQAGTAKQIVRNVSILYERNIRHFIPILYDNLVVTS
jgi:hypothetical protein